MNLLHIPNNVSCIQCNNKGKSIIECKTCDDNVYTCSSECEKEHAIVHECETILNNCVTFYHEHLKSILDQIEIKLHIDSTNYPLQMEEKTRLSSWNKQITEYHKNIRYSLIQMNRLGLEKLKQLYNNQIRVRDEYTQYYSLTTNTSTVVTNSINL